MGKGEDVNGITKQMKELHRMNRMIQNKLSTLESSLKKKIEVTDHEDEDIYEEEVTESDSEDEVIELPDDDYIEDVSHLVDVVLEEKVSSEDTLDQESRELLDIESDDDIVD